MSSQLYNKKSRNKFTSDEDNKLTSLVNAYGEKEWILISKIMRNRTSRQCRERWNYYLCPRINKGKWTNEEDEMLKKLYIEHGPKWMFLKQFFEGRTDAMLKNRFAKIKRKKKMINYNQKSKGSDLNDNAIDIISLNDDDFDDLNNINDLDELSEENYFFNDDLYNYPTPETKQSKTQ